MQTEILKKQLQDLFSTINKKQVNEKLKLHQQSVVKKHMSLSGGNGRIWITPSLIGYDVTLSGQSVEKSYIQDSNRYLVALLRDINKPIGSHTGVPIIIHM